MSSDSLEDDLRKALRRKPPSRDLTPPVIPWWNRWKLATAAALMVATLGSLGWQHHQAQQQKEAGEKLLFALQLTSEKLQRTQNQVQVIFRRHTQ